MTGEIETHLLADDGTIPNNRTLPLRLYRKALDVSGPDPAGKVARRFEAAGWRGTWVDGIYDFHHYHARSHEALGIARGEARVQFGGPNGPIVTLSAGDAAVLPPGTGHRCLGASEDLAVVGANPPGQEHYDLKRATPAEYAQALTEIASVPAPTTDPVTGREMHW